MKTTLPLFLLALLAAPACDRRPALPSEEVVASVDDAPAAATLDDGTTVPIQFGGKITPKKQPLRTKRLEERQKKVLFTTEKSSPASMLILEGGSITVDVCRPGFERRRRIEPEALKATLWTGNESLRFDLVAVDSTRDETGRAFRFQARRKEILSGLEMLLVVDVPNEAGDAFERATFVIPAGFEPY